MEGRARFSQRAAPLINQLPDGVFKELMLENLAKRTGLTRDVLNELQAQNVELEIKDSAPATAVAKETPPDTTAARQSALKLTPERVATILLLDNPQLLESAPNHPNLEENADPELSRLSEIIAFIVQRPTCNFNNIVGYWAGKYGISEQQALINLVADQIMGVVQTVDSYDPQKELSDAFNAITKKISAQKTQQELRNLMQTDPKQRSEEDKTRLKQLVAQAYQFNKKTK